MNLKAAVFGTLASCALLFSMDAQAKVLDLTFTSVEGDGSVRLVTTQIGSDHLVTSATGNIEGEAVSLIAPGGFGRNDNLIFPSPQPVFDFGGISFLAEFDYNLHFENGGFGGSPGYALCMFCNGVTDPQVFTFSLTVVPEPATWAMLLLGFFGIGAMIRTRRKRSIGLEAA